MSATEESLAGNPPSDRADDFFREIGGGAASGSDQLRDSFSTATAVAAQARGNQKSRKQIGAPIFILGMALLGGLLAWLWASNQGERYSATAVVQLEPADTIAESHDVVDVISTLDRGTIIVTAAGLANSGVVKTAAQQRLGLTSVQVDDYEVESLQVLTSHLIDITVTGPNEARSIAYADAVADEVGISFAESYPVYQMVTVTAAEVPDSSGRPGPAIIAIAAAIASAIGAFMLWLALFGGSDERTDLPLARRR